MNLHASRDPATPGDGTEASPSSAFPSKKDGLLFLGTGVSCALPQLGHVLPMGSPSHPFYPYLHVPFEELPSVHTLHQLSAANLEKVKKQRTRQHGTRASANEPHGPPHQREGRTAGLSDEQFSYGYCKKEDRSSLACVSCFMSWKNARDANHRNNVSAVLRMEGKNILIDCGKTFREASLAFFPLNHVRNKHAKEETLLPLGTLKPDSSSGLDLCGHSSVCTPFSCSRVCFQTLVS